jgi:hypothetical protein
VKRNSFNHAIVQNYPKTYFKLISPFLDILVSGLAVLFKSPLPFALVLLSIEWARCLGEMITVRRASSWQIPCPAASVAGNFFKT